MVLGFDTVMIGDPFKTLEGFYEGIDGAVKKIPPEGAKIIVEYAKDYVPIDLGDLYSSIKASGSVVSAGGDELVYKRGRDYAWFVEYGTSKTPAQPFMRPAFKKAAPQIAAMLANEAKDHFKGNHDIVPIGGISGLGRSLFRRKTSIMGRVSKRLYG